MSDDDDLALHVKLSADFDSLWELALKLTGCVGVQGSIWRNGWLWLPAPREGESQGNKAKNRPGS